MGNMTAGRGRQCAVNQRERIMNRQLALYSAGTVAICWALVAAYSEPKDRPAAKTTLPSAAQKEIASVEADIERIEAETLKALEHGSLDASKQIILLGKLIFY